MQDIYARTRLWARMVAFRASTTVGSNWVCEQCSSSATADGLLSARRHARSLVIPELRVADCDDACLDRDVVAGDAIRVAGAVDVLVRRADDPRDVYERG
jgi:hypothetical protein